jgi:hypothetical protein
MFTLVSLFEPSGFLPIDSMINGGLLLTALKYEKGARLYVSFLFSDKTHAIGRGTSVCSI